MLIYHKFATLHDAAAFGTAIRSAYPDRHVIICSDEADAARIDIFPFQMEGVAVLVARDESDADEEQEREADWDAMVGLFGGEFAGT